MDMQKTGSFIAARRRAAGLTQLELARKLGVTDKAVSKWERGLSCPDIALLSPLAECLDITLEELLAGESLALPEASGHEPEAKQEKTLGLALEYGGAAAKQRGQFFRRLATRIFSGAALLGAAVCVIVDLAVSGGLSWSFYPIGALAYAWISLFPALYLGRKGVWASLAAATAGILPFLWSIGRLTRQELVLGIGLPVSGVSFGYLWLVYGLFHFLKRKKLLAGGISLLAMAPLEVLIDLILARMIQSPPLEFWDMLTILLLLAGGGILIRLHFFWKNRKGA